MMRTCMICGKEDAIALFRGKVYPLSLLAGTPEREMQFSIGQKCIEKYQLNVDRENVLASMGSAST